MFINSEHDPKACVSFRTRVARLLIELAWDSKDNFDIALTNSAGTLNVGRESRTGNGEGFVLNKDKIETCDVPTKLDGKKEQIVYSRDLPEPPVDTYTVTVTHRFQCNVGTSTDWSVAIIINGISRDFIFGSSSAPGVVDTVSFTFP